MTKNSAMRNKTKHSQTKERQNLKINSQYGIQMDYSKNLQPKSVNIIIVNYYNKTVYF